MNLSNETFAAIHGRNLSPHTEPPPKSRRLAIPDWDAFSIGIAEYPEGPTGCTVFHFPGGRATCVPDVRGGAPGTIMATSSGRVDAICFNGGSCFGLESATGVTAELLKRLDYHSDWKSIPIVRGAVIYDFACRPNTIYPDKECGRAALRAAKPGTFPLGRRGAGCSATCGKMDMNRGLAEFSGQGGAYRNVGGVKVAVFTVVNSVGVIVDRTNTPVRGLFSCSLNRHLSAPEYAAMYAAGTLPPDSDETDLTGNGLSAQPPPAADGTPRNTTITVFVTNARFPNDSVFGQVVRSVHASMARAIQPFHLLSDGDVMYGVTTNDLDVNWTDIGGGVMPADPKDVGVDRAARVKFSTQVLSVVGGEVAWDAVLSCFDGE